MLVKRKRLEFLAVSYSKRFTKAWDYFTVSTSAYISAYKQARQEIYEELNKNCLFNPLDCGEEVIEEEITDGLHQLTITTFNEWEKQEKIKKDLTKDRLITRLEHDFNVKINELRWDEKDNLISFQGTMEKT